MAFESYNIKYTLSTHIYIYIYIYIYIWLANGQPLLSLYIYDISIVLRILTWNGQYLWHKSTSKCMLAEKYLQVLLRLAGTAVLCGELLRKFIPVGEKTETTFQFVHLFATSSLHFVDAWHNKKKNDNSEHISLTNNATSSSSSSHGVPRLLNALISHASTDATERYL